MKYAVGLTPRHPPLSNRIMERNQSMRPVRPRTISRDPNPNGFALVIVLMAVALLSALAGAFVFQVSTNTRATTNIVEGILVEALADGGARLAALELQKLRSGQQGARLRPGKPFFCSAPRSGAHLRLLTRDEAGSIDLNTSSLVLLKLFFTGLTKDPATARRFVDRLVDFRDQDNRKRPHGAETADYRAAGLAYAPKNGPLHRIEDLEQVLGMRGPIYRRALKFVTVNGFMSGIDPEQAAPELLAILRHGAGLIGLAADHKSGDIPSVIVSRSRRRTYRILSTALLPEGLRFTRDAVVELPPVLSKSVQFKRWMPAIITNDQAKLPRRSGNREPPC